MISFVGAGPGAPDLLTLRAVERLRAADVVVWAGSLVAGELLTHCRPGVEVHDSKGMTLAEVCAVYAAHPDATIVRLHSGDVSIYSAVAEQLAWCRAHDRAFEIVPGVSSMAAAAATAGCELTVPGVAQSVILTRLAAGTAASMPAAESIEALAATGSTMAVFLSVAQVDELARRLVAPPSRFTPDTPVVAVHRASWPDEAVVRTTVGELAASVRRAGFRATTLFLVGPAVAEDDPRRASHVYAPEYATRFRTASAPRLAGADAPRPEPATDARPGAAVRRPPGAGSVTAAPPVDVVGVVGGEVFGAAARAAVAGADVVVGSPRQLDTVAPGGAEWVALAGPLDPIVGRIGAERSAGRAVCVLASGDPGFFGIVRLLGARLGRSAVRVHPAPSAVALAFAAAAVSWDDAVVVSAHGRPLAAGVPALVAAAKAAVLTAPDTPPEVVGRALVAAGCGPRDVVVASRLGEADERVEATDLPGLAAGAFDPLSVVVLLAPDGASPGPGLSWGRSEDAFARRAGMITKAEVRAVALSKLELTRSGVLWDVGAGSGSVAVEAATLAPGRRVYAVEQVADDAARIGTNAAAAGVEVDVVVGAAPAALAGLPDPDRVFVGGGGPDVLAACWDRLRPAGRLVATFVVLDRALAAFHLLGSMVQVHVDRCVPIGGAGVRLEPLNPVFVCWGDKP